MGCVVSCVQQTTMSMFGKQSSNNNEDTTTQVQRKLYLAKESPEPDFDLSDCQLKEVPSGIYSICKVYRKDNLYLQENLLQSLDEGGNLSDLYLIKILNLSYNKLAHLHNDIRYLVNLRELYLQSNLIKVIPENIQYLQSLEVLDISKNILQKLPSSLGKLKCLRRLNIKQNKDLNRLCPELSFATNLAMIELDVEQYVFPPADVVNKDTAEIMKFLCTEMDIQYVQPSPLDNDLSREYTPNIINDPFAKQGVITWEQQEAAIMEQENKLHEAAKQQREKFLSNVMLEQQELDSEIAKVHGARDLDRQRLIKAIQDDEKEIESLVKNFIQSDQLKPEVMQQQLAHEQLEHDRLLEIVRQNYDNVKKFEILKAMENLIQDNYSIQLSKKSYEDSVSFMKQSMLMQELEGAEKLSEFMKSKDESRSVLVYQLLEDQDVQKAVVASLVEKVDARSWSLNQEISLISSNLAKLSVIEQEKKKLNVSYNYNELLHQRMQLVDLLNDLFDQKTKRRQQLVETLKEMEAERDASSDFWLRSYQKLIDSAPKTLLSIGKNLDPIFANCLLQEEVIHCVPFLVKFLFSGESLSNITAENLRECGVTLSADREGILRAIGSYMGAKSKNLDLEPVSEPSAPVQEIVDKESFTGVVVSSNSESVQESECVICMDSRCEVVFIPCGHMCCCLQCSDKQMESCPMCRSTIDKIIKVIVS